MRKTCLKFINYILFLFLFINKFAYSQFLEYSIGEKNQIIGLGVYKNEIKAKDDFNYLFGNPLECNNYIPFITYKDPNVQIILGYNKFKYASKSSEEFILKANYGGGLPLKNQETFRLQLPVRLQTTYIKFTQEKMVQSQNGRLDFGDVGIGSGLECKYDLRSVDFLLNFLIYLNYSTVNFSKDYGYSIQNDINFLIKFNQLFEEFGITLGLHYSIQKWAMSDKIYNYSAQWLGGYFGINF